MANWLTDVLGPKPAPRIVSHTTTGAPPMPGTPGATPGAAGGMPPGFDIAALMAKLDAEQQQANSAGLTQYKNLMGTVNTAQNSVLGTGGLYDQASGLTANMGNTQQAAINADEQKSKAESDQDLISRGLGNTTIRASNQRGIASDATAARSSLAEQVAAAKAGLLTQKAGATQQFAGMKGDAILSKTQTPNNAAMYAQLIQQLMANGGMAK